MPATEEGMRARKAIESERDSADIRIKEVMGRILAGARVFLPAGSDEAPGNLKTAVQAAAEKALVRLFPRFDEADHGSWSTVSKRVLDGAGDALGAVGYQGSPDKHPVVRMTVFASKTMILSSLVLIPIAPTSLPSFDQWSVLS